MMSLRRALLLAVLLAITLGHADARSRTNPRERSQQPPPVVDEAPEGDEEGPGSQDDEPSPDEAPDEAEEEGAPERPDDVGGEDDEGDVEEEEPPKDPRAQQPRAEALVKRHGRRDQQPPNARHRRADPRRGSPPEEDDAPSQDDVGEDDGGGSEGEDEAANLNEFVSKLEKNLDSITDADLEKMTDAQMDALDRKIKERESQLDEDEHEGDDMLKDLRRIELAAKQKARLADQAAAHAQKEAANDAQMEMQLGKAAGKQVQLAQHLVQDAKLKKKRKSQLVHESAKLRKSAYAEKEIKGKIFKGKAAQAKLKESMALDQAADAELKRAEVELERAQLMQEQARKLERRRQEASRKEHQAEKIREDAVKEAKNAHAAIEKAEREGQARDQDDDDEFDDDVEAAHRDNVAQRDTDIEDRLAQDRFREHGGHGVPVARGEEEEQRDDDDDDDDVKDQQQVPVQPHRRVERCPTFNGAECGGPSQGWCDRYSGACNCRQGVGAVGGFFGDACQCGNTQSRCQEPHCFWCQDTRMCVLDRAECFGKRPRLPEDADDDNDMGDNADDTHDIIGKQPVGLHGAGHQPQAPALGDDDDDDDDRKPFVGPVKGDDESEDSRASAQLYAGGRRVGGQGNDNDNDDDDDRRRTDDRDDKDFEETRFDDGEDDFEGRSSSPAVWLAFIVFFVAAGVMIVSRKTDTKHKRDE